MNKSRLSTRMADRSQNDDVGKACFDLFGNKWNERMHEEDMDMFFLGLTEEIINNCMNICYGNYLEKQAIAFTVSCAYLAWLKVLNVYDMPRDEGVTDNPGDKESWEPDDEPEPSEIDSWASGAMPVISGKSETKHASSKTKKVPILKGAEVPLVESKVESTTFASNLYDLEEGYLSLAGETDDLGEPSKKKSIFSRILSMSRELLPTLEPEFMHVECKEEVLPSKRKSQDEIIPYPEYLQATSLPPNRIDVKFAVLAASTKELKKGNKK